MKTSSLDRRLRKVEEARLPPDRRLSFPLAWLTDLEVVELDEIARRARARDPALEYFEDLQGADGERAMAIGAAAQARFSRRELCFDPTGELSAAAHLAECRIYHQELYPAARDSRQPFDDAALKLEAKRRAWAEVEASRRG